MAQSFDEEIGPRVVFAAGAESIYLADLSGEGLTGEVCYWPNLGYGHFGAKVTSGHRRCPAMRYLNPRLTELAHGKTWMAYLRTP